jgi:hypothetical protein
VLGKHIRKLLQKNVIREYNVNNGKFIAEHGHWRETASIILISLIILDVVGAKLNYEDFDVYPATHI